MNEAMNSDGSILVLDQTLISMKCEGESATVPSSFRGQPITTVGSGAVTLKGVKHLTIQPGIVRLKDRCLGIADCLESVSIPESVQEITDLFVTVYANATYMQIYLSRALTPDSYWDLYRAALPLGGNKRLIPLSAMQKPDMEPLRCMRPPALPIALIERDMRILFEADTEKPEKKTFYSGTIFDPRPCFDFVYGRQTTEEYTAVMELIRSKKASWYDPASEKEGDLRLRMGKASVTSFDALALSLTVADMPASPGRAGRGQIPNHPPHRKKVRLQGD